jgi:transcriptional regulator with XRE-family HTH domain
MSIGLVKNVIIVSDEGDSIMDIGKKIRDAREDMDLSQRDMAKLIPMNQSNYSKIERDVQEPSIEQLRRICQILQLDPRYLLNLGDFGNFSEEDLRLLRDTKEFIKNHKI